MVTKRSGQAQTALISRRPATVERITRGVTHPERIRATTNQVRIGDPVRRTRISQTKRVEFFGPRGPSGLSGRPRTCPFRFITGTKRRQINRLPNCQAQPAALFRRPSEVKSGCQSVASSEARCPDPGRGRRKRAQKQPESATRRVVRFCRAKGNPNSSRRGAGSQVMAPNALIPHDGFVCLLVGHPIQPKQSAGASQSIIAALRMHTIVACAGFSLRLRIR